MLHARDDYNDRIQDKAGKIPADEPVFLLRAQDPYAADAVQCWLNNYLSLTQEPDLAVVEQVQQHIGRMRAYQPKKPHPDLPEAEPPVEHCIYCQTTELQNIYVREQKGGKWGLQPCCKNCFDQSRGGPTPVAEAGELAGTAPKEPLTDVDPPPVRPVAPNDPDLTDATELAPPGEEGTSSADAPTEN